MATFGSYCNNTTKRLKMHFDNTVLSFLSFLESCISADLPNTNEHVRNNRVISSKVDLSDCNFETGIGKHFISL